MAKWDIKPGDQIDRASLQKVFGGRTQGKIGPSKSSPNVLIFSDPIADQKCGYTDGWQSDGCFHFTGEGLRGDQQMKSGNAAIIRHREEGRALRLFHGRRGLVTYIGQFELAEDIPSYTTDALEDDGTSIRSVVVFRLRPVDVEPKQVRRPPLLTDQTLIETVEINPSNTEKGTVAPTREESEADRREAILLMDFHDFLRGQGHEVKRLRIQPKGEAKPLYCDLFVPDLSLLIEVKGSVERGSIHMGIGQLKDYARFLPGCHPALVVPSRPRSDIVEFVQAIGVSLYWPTDTGFECLKAKTEGTH